MTLKLPLQWLPRQASGVLGSALGLVGPVSVYVAGVGGGGGGSNVYHSVAARTIV